MVWPMLIASVASLAGSAMQNQGQKDAAESAAKEKAADREFMMQQISQARNELGSIYPAIQQNTMMGGQAALDVLRGAYGAQAGVYDQSANNAMAAILGGQMNPYTIDQSYLNVQMPNYQMASIPAELYGPQQAAASSSGGGGGSKSTMDRINSYAMNNPLSPMQDIRNPLRLPSSINDKIDPVSSTKKLIKKFF